MSPHVRDGVTVHGGHGTGAKGDTRPCRHTLRVAPARTHLSRRSPQGSWDHACSTVQLSCQGRKQAGVSAHTGTMRHEGTLVGVTAEPLCTSLPVECDGVEELRIRGARRGRWHLSVHACLHTACLHTTRSHPHSPQLTLTPTPSHPHPHSHPRMRTHTFSLRERWRESRGGGHTPGLRCLGTRG